MSYRDDEIFTQRKDRRELQLSKCAILSQCISSYKTEEASASIRANQLHWRGYIVMSIAFFLVLNPFLIN